MIFYDILDCQMEPDKCKTESFFESTICIPFVSDARVADALTVPPLSVGTAGSGAPRPRAQWSSNPRPAQIHPDFLQEPPQKLTQNDYQPIKNTQLHSMAHEKQNGTSNSNSHHDPPSTSLSRPSRTGICHSQEMLKHWKPDVQFDTIKDQDDENEEPERPSRIARIVAHVSS
jgi:hypothetical protein